MLADRHVCDRPFLRSVVSVFGQSPVLQSVMWQPLYCGVCASSPPPIVNTFPDLAIVIENWAKLPEAIRGGIVAMIRAATV